MFRDVLSFLWERYGRQHFESGEPLPPDLMPYVEHTYRWASGQITRKRGEPAV